MTFPLVAINDIADIYDGPHATPVRRTSGKYFLSISSLNDGRLDLSQSDCVDDHDFAKWTRRVQPREGDLLFSYETRLGEAALMPEGIDAALGRRMALLRPNQGLVHPRFLLYSWLSPAFQAQIEQKSIHGATVDRIPLNALATWSIQMPDLAAQSAIADVLGALDDKIAANRRVQERARALATVLVERAQSQTPLASLASVSKKSIRSGAMDELVTHFSLPAFDQGLAQVERSAEIKSSKLLLTEPVVLVSKLNPRIPRIWGVDMLPEGMCVASTEFVPLMPTEDITVGVLWSALLAPDVTQRILSNVAGTTGSHQRVRPQDLLTVEVADVRTLSAQVRETLDGLCRVVNDRVAENVTLATTRDELLPLLMNGSITVKDAEKRVEREV